MLLRRCFVAENENKSTQKYSKLNYRQTAKAMALAPQVKCEYLTQFKPKPKRRLPKHNFTRAILSRARNIQEKFNFLTIRSNVITLAAVERELLSQNITLISYGRSLNILTNNSRSLSLARCHRPIII